MLILILLALGSAEALAPQQGPLSPSEAPSAMKLDAGLRVELAAAEPEVQSPVAVSFDEDGRMLVVEMLDYPYPAKDKPPQGRVKRLTDADGDGRYEKVEVLGENLLMSNGVMAWRGGALVTLAGELVWLKDGERKPLFGGFAQQNAQLRASFPTLGMDGWIYVANGQRGGKIKSAGGGREVDINAMDFRFDPRGDRYEAVTGFGQFGLSFDEWGNRFVCTNRNHLIHLVTPNRYFARNPFLAAPPPVRDNNGPGGAAKVFPISKNKTLAAHHAGTFTASCGVTVYTGDLLPAAYRGAVFTCEPTGNLVHMEILAADGAAFAAKPAKEGVEFLASTDAWFRPVSLANGPDGALYVVDMCRSEVEHPEWVPADQRHRYDFDGPRTFGRIWRVVPEAGAPRAKPLDRSRLVDALASPNAWTRLTAQRLLMDSDVDVSPALASPSPHARVLAAWILEIRGKLGPDEILKLLDDAHPRVREQALVFAEKFPELLLRAASLAGDPDDRVRWQAALSLGAYDDDRVLEPLARIASKRNDRWTRLAVASAVPTRSGALLAKIDDPAFARELAAVAGARGDAAELSATVASLGGRPPDLQAAILNGLADGMGRRGRQLGSVLDEPGRALLADVASRPGTDSIRLLAHLPWEAARTRLEKLLQDPAQDLRIAAVGALSAHGSADVAPMLMKSWRTMLPALRREVLEALARRPERLEFLLGEVEAGRVAPGELGPQLIRTLTSHGNAGIRERAKKALAAAQPEERQKVIERFKPALGLKGDAARGRDLFAKNCVACHRIGGLGTQVGPDITDTLSKTPEQLLIDLLDPSRVIDNNYATYLVRTKSGAVYSGFVAEQTASSLTLRRGEGQQDVVLRTDIEDMKSSGLSLMPEGLEKALDPQGLADLIAWLKHWRDVK
jgi:putative membrane-bound dehydrogenase-like protein